MKSSPRTVAIIPTFNEAENIGSLLLEISMEMPDLHVLVVDDNSPDGTQRIVERFASHDSRVHLLKRKSRQGLASAYIEGFDWAIKQNYDRCLQMDADFSHHPRFLNSLLEGLDDHDLVVGTRYIHGGGTSGWSWGRKAISRGGNIYAKLALGLPYRDLTGGFCAWSRKALLAIDYPSANSKGYAFQVELKYRAHRKNLKIKEVPILFANRQYGKSKMNGGIVLEAALRVLQFRFN